MLRGTIHTRVSGWRILPCFYRIKILLKPHTYNILTLWSISCGLMVLFSMMSSRFLLLTLISRHHYQHHHHHLHKFSGQTPPGYSWCCCCCWQPPGYSCCCCWQPPGYSCCCSYLPPVMLNAVAGCAVQDMLLCVLGIPQLSMMNTLLLHHPPPHPTATWQLLLPRPPPPPRPGCDMREVIMYSVHVL